MSTALSDNRPALHRAPLIVTGVVALAACLVTVVVGVPLRPLPPDCKIPALWSAGGCRSSGPSTTCPPR